MEQTSQGSNQESVPQRLVNTVKQRATAQLDSQKGRATDGLHAIAEAVRGSTQQLREDQHDVVAEYVERAADRIEAFSSALRERDLDALVVDARRIAREQPALVIGASFAVGLAAARFLKSSRRPSGAWHGTGAPVPRDYTARDAVTDVDGESW